MRSSPRGRHSSRNVRAAALCSCCVASDKWPAATSWFAPTDKRKKAFVLGELQHGRLRQGWGWRPIHDLRSLRAKIDAGRDLSEEEDSVWRNRRLLDPEPDGAKPGDIIVLLNLC